jgi:hypothetical protein
MLARFETFPTARGMRLIGSSFVSVYGRFLGPEWKAIRWFPVLSLVG